MTPGTFLKNLHRKALVGNLRIAFKQFVRDLKQNGTEEEKLMVDRWILNKGPTQRRLDKESRKSRKGALIEMQRNATRNAKRKRSGGK